MLNEITMDKVKTIRKKMLELQREFDIYLIDIEIVEEIDSQLMDKLSDDEYLKLFNEIEYAYLKTEGIELFKIVACAIKNKEKIFNNLESFSLRDEACFFDYFN